MLKEKQKGRGVFKIRQIRDGKVIRELEVENLTTTVGQNYLLATGFNGGSAITTWYAGLIDNSGFSAVDATDTMGSHAGWAEFVAYSGGARKTWGSGAPSGGAISNGTPMSYTMTGAGTIAGIFITSSSTLSGTSGTLWNALALGSPLTVAIADVLQVTYTYTLT